MLQIRQSQMDVFTAMAVQDLEDRTVRFVQSKLPLEFERRGEQGSLIWVRQAFRLARAHGLEDCYDILRYLINMHILGDDFDTRLPWAGDILNDASLTGRTRMDRLADRVRAELEAGRTQ